MASQMNPCEQLFWRSLELLDMVNTLLISKHKEYLKRCLNVLPDVLQTLDTTRLTVLFFAVSGLDLLGVLNEVISEVEKKEIIDWIYLLQLGTKSDDPKTTGTSPFRFLNPLSLSMDDLLCPGTLPPFTPFPKTEFSLGEIGMDGGCPEAIVTSVRGGQEVLLCSKMHGFCGIDDAAKDTLTKFRSVQPPTPLPEAVLRRKIFEPPWTAHDVADKLITEAWIVQQLDQSVYEGTEDVKYLAQFTGARFLKSGVKIKKYPLLEAPIQALAGIGPVKDPPLIGNCLDTHWCEDKRTLKLLHGEGLHYKWLRQRDFNYKQKEGIFVKPKTHEGGVELTEFARKFPAPITQVEYLGRDKERALVRTVDSVYTCDIDTGPLDDYSVLCGGKCRHFGTSPHIDSEIFVLDEEGELLWCKASRELNRIDTASPGAKSGDLVSAVWSDHPRVILGARNTEVTGFDLRTGTVATNLWKAEERNAEVCKLIASPLPGLFPIVQNHKVVLVDDRRPGVAVQSWWIPLAGVPEFVSSTYVPSRTLTEPGLLPVILAQRLFNEVVCLPNIVNLVRDGTASVLCGGSAPLSLSTPSEYASWFQDHIPQVELKSAYRRICAPLRGMKTDLINGCAPKYCGFRGAVIGQSDDAVSGSHHSQYDSGHLAMTYSALCCLLILGDDLSRVDRLGVLANVRACQLPDGSFCAHPGGSESDVRFVYCAASICHMLNDWRAFDRQSSAHFIKKSINYDGGIGQGPHLESHGGSTFCAVAALYLSNTLKGEEAVLSSKQLAKLKRWCLCRQAEGFHGRANKPDDSCYTFWISASLQMISEEGAANIIDCQKVRTFAFSTQDPVSGGFAKYSDCYPDPLHTYLAMSGLSILKENNLQPVHPALNISMNAAKRLTALHSSWSTVDTSGKVSPCSLIATCP